MRTRLFRYCMLVLLLGFVFSAHAGQWRETFDGDNLQGWTLFSKKLPKNWESKWEPRDSVLNATLRGVANLRIVDVLQWTVQPLHAANLTVTVHSIEALGAQPGEFGVFLGKQLPPNEADFASGYFFSKSSVTSSRFGKDGTNKGGESLALFIPRRQLKIIFQAGRFRLFSEEDILLTDFEDPDLTRVTLVGLLAMSQGFVDEFHGEVDTFIISGPGIPDQNPLAVQPKGKLATTWGKLKIQSQPLTP